MRPQCQAHPLRALVASPRPSISAFNRSRVHSDAYILSIGCSFVRDRSSNQTSLIANQATVHLNRFSSKFRTSRVRTVFRQRMNERRAFARNATIVRNSSLSVFRLELLGILFLVNLGIALRFRQYLFNRSLWFDEASLALNVVDRDVTTLLTKPLAYLQSAPPGFLVAARSMVVALGPSDWALRLVPFIAGVLVVLLAVLLARRELTSTVGRLTFVGLVALSPVLIFYSSEFKQYSSDALAAIAVLVGFSRRSSPYGTLLLAGTGFVALVCSLPAIFVAAPAGFSPSVRGRVLASVQAAPIRRPRMAGRGRAAWRLYLACGHPP